MSNYANLKSAIQSVIKTNGNNEITGQLLQNELLAMITTLGYGYQFMGVANPDTVPGTPDAKVFYIAYTPGTYTNFGGITVTGLCVLKFTTGWTKENIQVSGGTEFVVEPTDLTLSGTPQKLKFADRPYNSESPNGLGYKILREDLTFAEQVTEDNTIYEIRYVFDLGGNNVNIPSGCILKFNGGKISNGTLTLNQTWITDGTGFFDSNITLAGTIKNKELMVDWFVIPSGYGDAAPVISKLTNSPVSSQKVVIFGKKTYYIHTPISVRSDTHLCGGGYMYTLLMCLATNGGNMINLVNASAHSLEIEGFLFSQENKSGDIIYCDFEIDHLYIHNCYFNNPITDTSGDTPIYYAAIHFDTYLNPANGINALNIDLCKFSGSGSCIICEKGGDNVNITRNNMRSTNGYLIRWKGIVGTASVNVEKNALVGGGGMIQMGGVSTLTIRDNQIECTSALFDSDDAAVNIGSIIANPICKCLDVCHNNINLMTGLSEAACNNAIKLDNVHGAFIANNNFSSAYNILKCGSSYNSIVLIDTGIPSDRTTTYPGNVVDSLFRVTRISLPKARLDLGALKIKFNATSTSVTETGVISQKSGNTNRYVTYNAAIANLVDLNGFPIERSGTTAQRNGLYSKLLNGAEMVGFIYFDTDLGKCVVWNGSGWVNMDGSALT